MIRNIISLLSFASIVFICGDLWAPVTTTATPFSGGSITATTTLEDDVALEFGTSGDAKCRWETADANANALVCAAPEGGATNVPVFVWGDATLVNLDIGLFNGLTDPAIASVSDDGTKSISISHDGTNAIIDASSGAIVANDGLVVSSASGVILTGDGDGAITFQGQGNGTDEAFTLNLDDIANQVSVTTSTGVLLFDWDAIALDATIGLVTPRAVTASQVNVSSSAGVRLTGDGDGAITFLGLGNGFDENFTINLDDTENAGVWSSSTGLTLMDFGSINLKTDDITLGDVTITSPVAGELLATGSEFNFDMNIVPSADGGADLGKAGQAFEDLFLTAGSVINFNSDDVTITHSADTLTVAGGILASDVTGDLTGNADTSSALAANPTDCAAGNFATAIAANGDLTCASKTALKVGVYNINLKSSTTTDTNDSITVECGNESCSADNPGLVVMNSGTVGDLVQFTITTDVTVKLTGATWGLAGLGDVTGALIRALFVNDNGTLRTCFSYLGGRDTVLTTDTSATQADINLPEEILCNTAVASATNTALEFGFQRSNFDDTGGLSEDLWTNQVGVGDSVTGHTADGLYQPWIPGYTGFSANPTIPIAEWTQNGRFMIVKHDATAGTSSANTFTITQLPAKAREVASGTCGTTTSNSSNVGAAMWSVAVGGQIATMATSTGSTTGWGAANNKNSICNFIYEVGPAASFIE